MVDFNATQAALRSGYGPKWAKSQGSRLLGHPEIAAAVAEARERRSGSLALKRLEIEAELRRIALSDKEKTSDRLRALELAGRALGMFLDPSERKGGLEELLRALDVTARGRKEQAAGAQSEAETPAPTGKCQRRSARRAGAARGVARRRSESQGIGPVNETVPAGASRAASP
jgi:hypothetical protein